MNDHPKNLKNIHLGMKKDNSYKKNGIYSKHHSYKKNKQQQTDETLISNLIIRHTTVVT